MFKVGDKVVCVRNGSLDEINNLFGDKSFCLTLHKTYTVVDIKDVSTISIINDNDYYQSFNNVRFISLLDFRKQKLEKICSKLEMK